MSGQGSDLYLSPNEQDLLVAALNSNHPSVQSGNNHDLTYTPQTNTNPGSGHLDLSDDSPYLDFDPDGDFDDSFGYENSRMIGDLPDLHDKRKSIDGDDNEDEGDRKRREGDDKTAKKPGRKPLTSEPTSKRKAQNRAAQRAFRERKERHLKDLETKVEDLEKASEATSHENGLLKAQVERLQVELKEYRKRLSWISSNGVGRSNSLNTAPQKNTNFSSTNDFQFEFPKFGDLPAMPSTNIFNGANGQSNRTGAGAARANTLPKANSVPRAKPQAQPQRQSSSSQSPLGSVYANSPRPVGQQQPKDSVDSLSGLFSPSILEATRQASLGGYFPLQNNNTATNSRSARGSIENGPSNALYSNSTTSNSDSPSSSSESHNAVSSMGTSPEPSLNSPANKLQEFNLNTINEENQMPSNFGKDELCRELSTTCGCAEDPIPPILNQNLSNDAPLGFNNANFSTTPFDVNSTSWLPVGTAGEFDPVLFGDYREAQDNILSQDFGSFFNDAYPLPDLGSPLHNYNDVASDQAASGAAVKMDLLKQVEAAKNGTEEMVPNTDKPMTCNKIWQVFPPDHAGYAANTNTRDRLQSMEKFRNGEIDIDNLCSELRAKAKCSEGGAVVDKKDVDKILGK